MILVFVALFWSFVTFKEILHNKRPGLKVLKVFENLYSNGKVFPVGLRHNNLHPFTDDIVEEIESHELADENILGFVPIRFVITLIFASKFISSVLQHNICFTLPELSFLPEYKVQLVASGSLRSRSPKKYLLATLSNCINNIVSREELNFISEITYVVVYLACFS